MALFTVEGHVVDEHFWCPECEASVHECTESADVCDYRYHCENGHVVIEKVWL